MNEEGIRMDFIKYESTLILLWIIDGGSWV